MIRAQSQAEFQSLLSSPDALKEARRRCGDGEIHIRSILWRIFFGLLPTRPSDWPNALQEMRHRVRELRFKHQSTADGNGELRMEMMRDISRAYPEIPFFQSEKVQQCLVDVCWLWCVEHPSLGYRQGMHDLASPIVFVLWKEATTEPSGDGWGEPEEGGGLFESLTCGATVTLDSFLLFDKVMHRVHAWFDSGGSWVNEGQGGMAPPVARLCLHLQDSLLPIVDRPLARRLKRLGLDPQLYALRWIRLLFTREFHLDVLLRVWDALFASERGVQESVEWMCLSMLIHMRTQLLALDDFSLAMQRLMHFPPVEDPSALIERAWQLAEEVEMGKKRRVREKASVDERQVAQGAWTAERVLAMSANNVKGVIDVLEEVVRMETQDDKVVALALADLKLVAGVLGGRLAANALEGGPVSVKLSQKI